MKAGTLQATPALCLALGEASIGLVGGGGAREGGRATPSWVLSAAVDVAARMEEEERGGWAASNASPSPFMTVCEHQSQRATEGKRE